MQVQNIKISKYLNFGEVNQFGTVLTVESLNDHNKTVCIGENFDEDVFEYTRKQTKLPKDYDMHKVINTYDLIKLTNTSSTEARRTKLIKMLAQKGLLKK